MSGTTSIEWTDATANPLTHRCDPVSEECDNCYAATDTARWHGPGAFTSGPPVLQRPKLLLPWTDGRMREGQKIFLVSMSDPFHSGIPVGDLALMWAMMAADRRHTYQLTTKRHGVMRSRLTRPGFPAMVQEALGELATIAGAGRRLTPLRRRILADVDAARASPAWPLPNVWLGVSAGTQPWADRRIEALLGTPAAVRWVSAEPLLGPLSLHRYLREGWPTRESGETGRWTRAVGLDWVVTGGESGRRPRPMQASWARALRDQCKAAGVAFFFKQLGTVLARDMGAQGKGGDWEQLPSDLRVREFPAAA